jgi:Tol biopolymer transport system component
VAAKAKCRGGVPAVIGGVRRCLRPGQHCNRRLDRQYHKYRFHCHSGRLARFPKAKPPPPPPFDFAAPTDLPLNSAGFDGGPSSSDDGLSLFFISDRPGGQGGDIWMATRATTSVPFGSPVNLGPVVNGPGNEGGPSISSDGLSLYFDSDASRPGGQGSGDIWVTTRPSTSAAFGPAANLGPIVNSIFAEGHPDISADGRSLYFSSGRPGTCGESDIWVATRQTPAAPFGAPVNLGSAVNTCASDEEPSISMDGLALFFSSNRPGGSRMHDLWVATRSSPSASFGHPVNLGRAVNGGFDDRTPDISSDGATLYFISDRPGGVGFFDIWESRREG